MLEKAGHPCAVLSIDDFYLTRKEQVKQILEYRRHTAMKNCVLVCSGLGMDLRDMFAVLVKFSGLYLFTTHLIQSLSTTYLHEHHNASYPCTVQKHIIQ